MNDNIRNRIFLRANNIAVEKHGKFYTELSPTLQEAIWHVAVREINASIRAEIEEVM